MVSQGIIKTDRIATAAAETKLQLRISRIWAPVMRMTGPEPYCNNRRAAVVYVHIGPCCALVASTAVYINGNAQYSFKMTVFYKHIVGIVSPLVFVSSA